MQFEILIDYPPHSTEAVERDQDEGRGIGAAARRMRWTCN